MGHRTEGVSPKTGRRTPCSHPPAFMCCLALALPLGAADVAPRTLTLDDALRLAHSQGRTITTEREDLALQEATLAKVRGDYRPIPSASLGASASGTGSGQPPSLARTGEASVSQSLPGGGTATVSGSATSTHDPHGLASISAGRVSVSLTQPLLRGAGNLVWRENLTEAERALLYEQRRYATFREDLTISTATAFWGLQRQQAAVAAARAAEERAAFTYQQSQALMSVGKTNANDVFRAETNVLQAKQAVIDEEAAFATQADALKLELTIDPAQSLSIDTTPPRLDPARIDAAMALTAALERRRDLATAHDAVADAARAFALARRDLLPRLDANARIGWNGALEDDHAGWDQPPAWQAALSLDVPLDRRAERLSLDRARVAHLRAMRSESEQRERVIVQVREGIRQLRSAQASLTIQSRNYAQAKRRAEKAEIDFKSGELSNRDLVEAQNDVRSADDARYAALVSYRIAELSLRRDTGTLAVRDDGSWDPALPPYAAPEDQP